jgi:hypothetical protein
MTMMTMTIQTMIAMMTTDPGKCSVRTGKMQLQIT